MVKRCEEQSLFTYIGLVSFTDRIIMLRGVSVSSSQPNTADSKVMLHTLGSSITAARDNATFATCMPSWTRMEICASSTVALSEMNLA